MTTPPTDDDDAPLSPSPGTPGEGPGEGSAQPAPLSDQQRRDRRRLIIAGIVVIGVVVFFYLVAFLMFLFRWQILPNPWKVM